MRETYAERVYRTLLEDGDDLEGFIFGVLEQGASDWRTLQRDREMRHASDDPDADAWIECHGKDAANLLARLKAIPEAA